MSDFRRKIYYSVDGSVPTSAATLYSAPFAAPASGVVKAGAFAAGMMDSDIASMDVQALAKAGWKVVFVDSFEAGEGEKVHAIDGKPDTFWHTQWSGGAKRPPHEIQIDLGRSQKLAGFTYLPRQNQDNGRIGKYEFFVSADGKDWGKPVARANSAIPLACKRSHSRNPSKDDSFGWSRCRKSGTANGPPWRNWIL